MRKRQYKKLKRSGVCPQCRRWDTSGVWSVYRLKSGRWASEIVECWDCGWNNKDKAKVTK